MNSENEELDDETGDVELEANLRQYFELHPEARPDVPSDRGSGEPSDEVKEREIEEINRNVRAIIEGRKHTSAPSLEKKAVSRARTWVIGVAASLAAGVLIGAFLFSDGGSPKNMVAQATYYPIPQRGDNEEKGDGIKVVSPRDGFVTVVLLAKNGDWAIWPGSSAEEIKATANQEIVVEVLPNQVPNIGGEPEALVFVTEVGGVRSELDRYLSSLTAEQRTSPTLSDLVVKHLYDLKHPMVIPGAAPVPITQGEQ